MAHNQLTPNYSSSDDDEDEEEEASDSEDDQPSASDSDQLSDSLSDKKALISPSETDSDSDLPPALDPNIKPISSVPMELNPHPDSKLIIKSLPMARSKRPPANDDNNNNNLKKAKTGVGAVDDDSKKQLFQRLWSEDDEIVILKGMIDYKADTGESLIADMGVFHEFIKKSLHVDVSRAQLVDKIRRLRKKYVNNASREKDGKDRSFSKSHEQRGYELSKLIWGGGSQKNGNAASTSNTNGVDGKEGLRVELVEKSVDINRFVRYSGRDDSPVVTEEIVKAGMELVEGSKRVELEDKWKRLKKEELEIYLKKMELIKEQALVVLEAVNSSAN